MQPYEDGEYFVWSAVRRALVLGAIPLALGAGPQAWSDSPHVVAISLVGGRPNGSELTFSGGRAPVLRLRQGEVVELRWSTDRSMALHLHGYNLELQTTPARKHHVVHRPLRWALSRRNT